MALGRANGRWWGRMALGVIALIAGLAFLIVPGITLVVFLWIFGAFMILTGLVLISYAWSRPKGTRPGTLNFAEEGLPRRPRPCRLGKPFPSSFPVTRRWMRPFR